MLRNHVETILEFRKKSESDSGFHKAMRDDLEKAQEVHRAFFPGGDVLLPGLECEIFYKPVHTVGGDYYDFVPLKDECWGIAVGDVSGKGIGAALLMASLQASLRAQVMHAYSDLPTLIADVDRLVLAASPKHLYATLFYGEYDTTTRMLRYVNAGHPAPLLLRWTDAECEIFRLEPSGTPLGLLEDSQFTTRAFQLKKGDLLVMYTDGITEVENSEGSFWGQERLENVLRACADYDSAEIIGLILREVLSFSTNHSQGDDMTLTVIRVRDEAGI